MAFKQTHRRWLWIGNGNVTGERTGGQTDRWMLPVTKSTTSPAVDNTIIIHIHIELSMQKSSCVLQVLSSSFSPHWRKGDRFSKP